MIILVTDTNVFIDIVQLEIVAEVVALEEEIHTSQFVIHELNSEQRSILEPYVNNGDVTVKEFDPEELLEVVNLNITRSRVAKRMADKSVIYMAQQCSNRVVVSGDRSLRNEANDFGIECHGTIWLIKQIYLQQIIEHSETIELLDRLKSVNTFLPVDEIEKEINTIKEMIE